MKLKQGTEVQVDIPDRADPDFEQYHRRCGTIIAIVEDNTSELMGTTVMTCYTLWSSMMVSDRVSIGETSDQSQSSLPRTEAVLY
jgi:hypothetical protein